MKAKKDGFVFKLNVSLPDNGSVVDDIRSSALPLREIPSFMLWTLRHSFWFWFVLIIGGMLLIVK